MSVIRVRVTIYTVYLDPLLSLLHTEDYIIHAKVFGNHVVRYVIILCVTYKNYNYEV